MLNKKACREFAAPGVAMSPDNELLHAEQNKYIVQTAVRIIGHRKTLVLYFHDRKQAAQGDFRPVWTMFHSKDGYITLERKEDGKTTWRTAGALFSQRRVWLCPSDSGPGGHEGQAAGTAS